MPNSRMPVITDMQVIPVAGQDSMLLSLSGAHSPWFTRNLVLLTDSPATPASGRCMGARPSAPCSKTSNRWSSARASPTTGTHCSGSPPSPPASGGDRRGHPEPRHQPAEICRAPRHRHRSGAARPLRQFVELPVCALLGDGQQHEEITILAYLFYVADKSRTDLPYLDESDSPDRWFSLRRGEAMTPERSSPGGDGTGEIRLPRLQAQGRGARARGRSPDDRAAQGPFPRRSGQHRPQRRLAARDRNRDGPAAAGGAHLRRGPLRHRSGLFGQGDDGRI